MRTIIDNPCLHRYRGALVRERTEPALLILRTEFGKLAKETATMGRHHRCEPCPEGGRETRSGEPRCTAFAAAQAIPRSGENGPLSINRSFWPVWQQRQDRA